MRPELVGVSLMPSFGPYVPLLQAAPVCNSGEKGDNGKGGKVASTLCPGCDNRTPGKARKKDMGHNGTEYLSRHICAATMARPGDDDLVKCGRSSKRCSSQIPSTCSFSRRGRRQPRLQGCRTWALDACESVVSSRVGIGNPIQSRSGAWCLGVLSQHSSFTAGLSASAGIHFAPVLVSLRAPHTNTRKRLERHGSGLDWKQA